MNSPILGAGDRLIVGQVTYPIQEFTKLFPGDATINGPLVCGANYGGPPTANAMFGPGFTGLPSLESVGITNIFGSLNIAALSTFTGITNKFGATFKHALSLQNGLHLKNALNLANGPIVFNGQMTATSIIVKYLNAAKIDVGRIDGFNACFTTLQCGSTCAPVKEFNIKHPSRPGYRLVHACLEGPEIGVYFRGHLKDHNQIILPDFWNNLIDPESITVHFTPHKFYQELYVKSIEWGKVINVVNNAGGPIDCDYIVYAERIDIKKLVVEYEDDGRIQI